jgi:hypothetical protein
MTRQYKPLTAPKSRRDIADQLRWLAKHMADIATSMDYYGGHAPWAQHGKELAGAALICKEWAVEIEQDPEPKFMDDVNGHALASGGF